MPQEDDSQTAQADHRSGRADVAVVGLIAPPGKATDLAQSLSRWLPTVLARQVDAEVPWEISVVTDPMAGAGNASELLDETHRLTERHGWQLGICLTDLPIYRGEGTPSGRPRIVVADVSHHRGVAAVSVPALGVLRLRRRLRQAVLRLAGELHTGPEPVRSGHEQTDESPAQRESATAGQLMQDRLTALTVPTRRVSLQAPEEGSDTRFASPAGRGHLRLWSGLVAANRPWAVFRNFTAVVAAAFATGAYGLIFPSVWSLADTFTPTRLIILMLLAMTSMVSWIIISHRLWEPAGRNRRALPLAALYNWVTVLTLSVAVLISYAALFGLLLVAAVALIPVDHLQSNLGHPVSGWVYGVLAWTAASIATVAGALGAGLESDEDVRAVTVSARQRRRLERLQNTNDESDAGPDG